MAAKPAWWQTTRTARQGFWLGGGIAVLGLFEVAQALTRQARFWGLILGAVYLATGLGVLVAAGQRADGS